MILLAFMLCMLYVSAALLSGDGLFRWMVAGWDSGKWVSEVRRGEMTVLWRKQGGGSGHCEGGCGREPVVVEVQSKPTRGELTLWKAFGFCGKVLRK